MIYIDLAWWQWLFAGLALMLLELLLPSPVLLLAGVAAVTVAVATALFPLPPYGPLALWCVLTVSAVYLRFRFRVPTTPVENKLSNGVGMRGVLLEDIEGPASAQVLLQEPLMGVRQWPAVADEPIGAGERVYVVSINETRVKVARALLIDMVH